MVIVIATASAPATLGRTLASLIECVRPASFDRLLLVENGDRRGVEGVVQGLRGKLNAQYLFEPARSKTMALNLALSYLNNELVVFFDDDVRLAPTVLQCYADAAETHGEGYYFGGPTSVDYEEEPPAWLKRFLPPSAVGHEIPCGTTEVQYPSFFLGFNWAAFADDLKKCGGFHPDFGPGRRVSVGDESFMQFALNRRGIVGRYLPDARVWHSVPKDRCTPQWVLRRAYPNGFAAGAFSAYWAEERRQRLGLARSLREVLRSQIRRTGIKNILTCSNSGRLGIRVTLAYTRGFLAGYRYSRAERPFDPRPTLHASYQCGDAEMVLHKSTPGHAT